MESREERIRMKAHELWESDGRPEGQDRHHWEQAAKLIDEEDRLAAEHGGESPTNDPIGVTLGAMKRQG